MYADAAHKSSSQIGEVVFGVPLFAALVLQLIVPLTFNNSVPTSVFLTAGIILCIMAATLIVAARRVFLQYGQPTDPRLATSSVVTTRNFSVSRNPMYLGAVSLLIGIALIFEVVWIFVFLGPTVVACHLILIEPEERYLEAKLGTKYQNYAASVNRWIGRRR